MPDERIDILRTVSLFDGLSDRELEAVANAAKERRFDTGDTVVGEGEGGVGFFVVADGHGPCRGVRPAARDDRPGGVVRRGGAARRRRPAHRKRRRRVAAARVRLTAWQFTPLLEQHPSIARQDRQDPRPPPARGRGTRGRRLR